MDVTVIQVLVEVLGTISKNLEKRMQEQEIWGRIEAGQTMTLLKSTKILRQVLENWEDLFELQGKPPVTTHVKILQRAKFEVNGFQGVAIKPN